MKHFYLRPYRFVLPVLFMFTVPNVYAQCPEGQPAGQTAYDTTISFPAGTSSMQVKFPQFDPTAGMITCMKLCVTVGGVVNRLSFENTDVSNSSTGAATYGRIDQISGPGISGTIMNSLTKSYSFPVGPADNGGVANEAGSDYAEVLNDTILSTQSCQTLSSAGDLIQFYGSGMVTYNYNIIGGLSITSGDNMNIKISTSGFVRIKFEYCTCPGSYLPINLESFNVKKIAPDQAELRWKGFDDPEANFYYEAEVSRNAYDYTSIGILPKNMTNAGEYKMNFAALKGESGAYYFRIKQIYPNGNVKYSITRQLVLESSAEIKFSVFPNPSNGIVGIKFDNISAEEFAMQIYNTQGQVIVKKDLAVSGSSYVQVATLKSGVYWLRLTSRRNQVSSVHQLLIK